MSAADHVVVCIASIGRNSLSTTVESVLAQSALPSAKVRVVIADDGPTGAVAAALGALNHDARVTLVTAPGGNIAAARNACLDAAMDDADFLAFIDDDEIADPFWLRDLRACLDGSKADVAFGAVEPIFLEGCPSWAAATGLFRKQPAANGAQVQTGSTCNALVKVGAVVRSTRFDPTYGRTGGEDTMYFAALHAAGLKLAATNAALVREYVTPERLELGKIRARYVRGGQTFALMRRNQLSGVRHTLFVMRSMTKAVALGAVSLLPTGDRAVKVIRKMRYWGAVGEVRASVGRSLDQLYPAVARGR